MKKLSPLLLLLMFSCSSELLPAQDPYADCISQIESYHPSKADQNGLIEGDIIPDMQIKGLVIGDKTWPNKTIPFYFKAYIPGTPDNGFRDEEHKEKIRANIKTFSEQTGFTFIEFANKYRLWNEYPNGVQITTAFVHNSSYVGMQPTLQVLKLTFGLEEYVMHHELGHVAGLEHEFKRSDRDEHITVHYDNIPEYSWRQFDKSLDAIMCGPFDIESIMMYDPFNFAIDPELPAITLSDGSLYVFSKKLSKGDIETLNTKYN